MNDNFKVGLLTILGLIVFVLVLVWKTTSIVDVKGYYLIGRFQSISGLLETADVRFRGYKVGRVARIEPLANEVLVYAKIQQKVKIPANSTFIIAFDGLIGLKYVAIVPGSDDVNYCKPGDILQGQSSAGIVDFVQEGSKALEEAKLLLSSLREITSDKIIKESIYKTIKNFEKISNDVEQLTPAVKNTVLGLEELVGEIKPIFADGVVNDKFKKIIINMESASSDLEKITKQVNKITGDSQTEENVKVILQNIREISEELKGLLRENSADNEISQSIKDSLKFMKRVNSFEFRADADLIYSKRFARTTVRAGAALKLEPNEYWAIRAGEIEEGSGAVLDIVKGNKLKKNLWWHYGIIQTNLGAGLDYLAFENISLRTDFFSDSRVKANISAKWKYAKNWALVAMLERIGELNGNYYIGFNLTP